MEIISRKIHPNGNFPNNPNLPLLLYKSALDGWTPEEALKQFEKHHWIRGWINGIYDFHHYHSNIHEALGICKGTATVQVGGEGGPIFELQTHDLLILPAGVAHRKLKSTKDFVCVGAYPLDEPYNMHEGNEDERHTSEKLIRLVPLPEQDPIYGIDGPIFEYWKII